MKSGSKVLLIFAAILVAALIVLVVLFLKPLNYVVKFNTNCGTTIENITVKKGGSIKAPITPTNTGHTFDGWYVNSNLSGDKVDFPFTPQSDVILYAKWIKITYIYQVKFESNGGSYIDPVNIIPGEKINCPMEPVYFGYTFDGWYINSNLSGDKVDFPFTSQSDVMLYAKWIKITDTYQVKFESNGGSYVDPVNIIPGEKINCPMEPIYSGYTFAGWFKEAALINHWDFDEDIVNEDIIIYAKWVDGSFKMIRSKDNLQGISLTGKYVLAYNINLNGAEWVPIGVDANLNCINFEGFLDGNGCVISNFKITKYYSYTGLFGINEGTIENIGIENFSININCSKMIYAGGLAGYNSGGIINNSYTSGEITIASEAIVYAGGMAGQNFYGEIKNSYSETDICITSKDSAYGGGLSGMNEISKITYCHYKGTISVIAGEGTTGTTNKFAYAGGIAGKNLDEINCSYSAGTINAIAETGIVFAGGLVADNYGSIENCYSVCNINATAKSWNAYAGGFIGQNAGIVNNSYAAGNINSDAKDYNSVGGFIGQNSGSINYSYASGNIYATAKMSRPYAGGLMGESNNKITKCYRYSGQEFTGSGLQNDFGEECSLEDLNNQVFFTDMLKWDNSIWDLDNIDFENGQYPVLRF